MTHISGEFIPLEVEFFPLSQTGRKVVRDKTWTSTDDSTIAGSVAEWFLVFWQLNACKAQQTGFVLQVQCQQKNVDRFDWKGDIICIIEISESIRAQRRPRRAAVSRALKNTDYREDEHDEAIT